MRKNLDTYLLSKFLLDLRPKYKIRAIKVLENDYFKEAESRKVLPITTQIPKATSKKDNDYMKI